MAFCRIGDVTNAASTASSTTQAAPKYLLYHLERTKEEYAWARAELEEYMVRAACLSLADGALLSIRRAGASRRASFAYELACPDYISSCFKQHTVLTSPVQPPSPKSIATPIPTNQRVASKPLAAPFPDVAFPTGPATSSTSASAANKPSVSPRPMHPGGATPSPRPGKPAASTPASTGVGTPGATQPPARVVAPLPQAASGSATQSSASAIPLRTLQQTTASSTPGTSASPSPVPLAGKLARPKIKPRMSAATIANLPGGLAGQPGASGGAQLPLAGLGIGVQMGAGGQQPGANNNYRGQQQQQQQQQRPMAAPVSAPQPAPPPPSSLVPGQAPAPTAAPTMDLDPSFLASLGIVLPPAEPVPAPPPPSQPTAHQLLQAFRGPRLTDAQIDKMTPDQAQTMINRIMALKAQQQAQRSGQQQGSQGGSGLTPQQQQQRAWALQQQQQQQRQGGGYQ